MIRSSLRHILPGLVILAAATWLATAQDTPPRQIRDTITEKGIVRVKIALPDFEAAASEKPEARELVDTIRADLEFSGYFDVVDPALYSRVPASDKGAVRHDDWLSIGADAVTQGKLALVGGKLDVEARLYDNPSKARIFGMRYGGTPDLLRRVAHQVSDDLIKHYTGKPGVAMTRIAYVSKHGDGKEIYLMDYDGQRIRRLTTTSTINLFPVWSPEGNRLAFVSWRGRQPGIRIMDADGQLTSVPALKGELNSTPSWFPDGKKLAFSSDADRNSEIYVLTIGSAQTSRLTRHPAIDTSPAVSPTGRQIAFTSDRGGSPQIYVMDPEGLNVSRLSTEGSYNDSPAWSPRGDKLVYSSRVEGRFKIVVLDIERRTVTQLTQGNGNDEDPRYSPDGRHIVFSSSRGGGYDIYTMGADGTGVRRLTRGGDSYTPDWSR